MDPSAQPHRFDIRPDSSGAGLHRGGVGYVREYEVMEDCVLILRSSNHQNPAWGVHGNWRPMPSRVVLNPDGPHPEQLEPTVTRPLRRGDVLRFEQSGGGGFGWPEDRADELGAADMHGYVNADAARWIDRKHTEIPMIEEMS